ncbi:hypothetical protein D3C76_1725410 [compost metagenome]
MKKQQLLALSGANGDGRKSLQIALSFLEHVSAEEKTGPEWLSQMNELNKLLPKADGIAGAGGMPSFYIPTLAGLLG